MTCDKCGRNAMESSVTTPMHRGTIRLCIPCAEDLCQRLTGLLAGEREHERFREARRERQRKEEL